jgi:N-acyl-D-amino-acid deacylase
MVKKKNKSSKGFDIAITGGRVLEPDCAGFREINIGITADRIATITDDTISARTTIKADGLVVSPGFVDIHTHVDNHPYAALCEARMGVTTSIGNNCGMGVYPLDAFEQHVARNGFPINQGLLVGHQNLREELGIEDRYSPLDPSSIDELSELAEQALSSGAVGISFGLAYVPGTSTDEINALASLVAEHDSILTAHPRHAAHGLPGIAPDAVEGEDELIRAGGLAGARVQISHIGSQIAWPADPYDDLLRRGLERLEKAREEGVDVMADCHPYDAWCTHVGAAVLDPFQLDAFREYYNVGFDIIQIAEGSHRGVRLTESLYFQLRDEAPNTHVIGYMMREDLVARALASPFVMVGSDSVFAEEDSTPTHPRSCGTFPRAIRMAVREYRLLTLEEALYKMTLMPAERFGLRSKGRIEVGADADIVIFDPDSVADLATYMEPDQPCPGIEHVLVNGVPVIKKGKPTNARPGRYLRRGK